MKPNRHTQAQLSTSKMGNPNKIAGFYQCQHPACDILEQFCKMSSSGETGYRIQGISLYYFVQLHENLSQLKFQLKSKSMN